MRLIGWLLLLLIGLNWLASQLPSSTQTSSSGLAANWRRTVNGWERLPLPATEGPTAAPAIHPALLGMLEILATLAAMKVFSPVAKRTQKGGPRTLGP
jgi:hypothetical protein